MSENSHQMTTRSKAKDDINEMYESQDMITDDDSSVDEHGNLKGFIDYDCDDDFDHKELDKQLNRLRGVKPKRKKKRNIKKQKKNDKKLNDVFMTYLIMKATEKANIELKNNRKKDGQIFMNYHQILVDVAKKMMTVVVAFNLLVIS